MARLLGFLNVGIPECQDSLTLGFLNVVIRKAVCLSEGWGGNLRAEECFPGPLTSHYVQRLLLHAHPSPPAAWEGAGVSF